MTCLPLIKPVWASFGLNFCLSPVKATPEYIQFLLETIDQAPEAFGYDFGRWTKERLATYLAQQTGIILSGSLCSEDFEAKKV